MELATNLSQEFLESVAKLWRLHHNPQIQRLFHVQLILRKKMQRMSEQENKEEARRQS